MPPKRKDEREHESREVAEQNLKAEATAAETAAPADGVAPGDNDDDDDDDDGGARATAATDDAFIID
ncbi:hypothetical protein GGF32_007585 [Allomyces javanicus]|nr:hypothetical protein GGF32_007585 [Allomyces javanicus]